MNTIDIVFLILLAVTVILFTAWEMITTSLVTGVWVGFRRLLLLCGVFAVGACLLFAFPASLLARFAGWAVPIIGAVYVLVSISKDIFEKARYQKQIAGAELIKTSNAKSRIILIVLVIALFVGVFLYWLLFRQYGGTGLLIEFVLGLSFASIMLGVVLVILFRKQKPTK